jgi:Paf1
MDVGILEPKEVPDFGTDFVFSAFLPDPPSTTETIKDHLSSGTDLTSPPFTYTHVRDYEGNLINPPVKSDYAVYFLNERIGTQRRGAYYLPITGKSNLKRRRTTKSTLNSSSYIVEDKIDGIELTLRGQTSEEAEVYERAKKEFEEGGPKVEEEMVETPDDDDGLSDTDAIGEVDPMYT